MGDKREKWIGLGLCLLVLGAMLLFFEKAHPLVILDADDWTYISQSRAALPSVRFWNPARILPEILMPYGVSLGVLLFSRLGYIQSITVTNGLILSLFITFYVWEFYLLLARRLRLRPASAALLSLVFLLLHFLIFRRELSGNSYLFRANDVTCVYYYVIPGLLNGALLLLLLRTGEHRRLLERDGLLRRSLLLPAVYLAVFSNLFESVLLAAFCGAELLLDLLRARREKPGAAAFGREHVFHLAVLLLWLASVWFEGRGARGETANPLPYGQALGRCLGLLPGFFGGMNRAFLLLCLGCPCLVLALGLARRLPQEERALGRALLLPLLIALLPVLLFALLLCARVSCDYITRSDVMFPLGFGLIALGTVSLGLLLRRWPRLLLLLPLLLLVLYSMTNTCYRTFLDSNDLLAPGELCTAMDEDLLAQIKAAEAAGEKRVTVYVAHNGHDGGNWPQTVYMGPRVAASLYKHGVTGRLMEVEIVPSREVNARLHVMEENLP